MNDKFKFHKSAIEWRRGIVLQKLSQGYSQSEIAKELQLHPSTISLDCQCLRLRAQENIKNHIEERIPAQYEECHVGLKIVLRKAWEISNSSNKTSEVLQALSLISDTYGKLMDLTTDGTTLEQAMNWVTKQKEKERKAPTSDGSAQAQEQEQEQSEEEEEEEEEIK